MRISVTLSGAGERVVRYKLRSEYRWGVVLGIFLCVCFQSVHSDQRDILKEDHQPFFEKQLNENVGFRKTENDVSQLHSDSCCRKSETVQESLDLDATLEQHSISHQRSVSSDPELFIFVSNSMPEQSLKQWAIQGDKVGGTLVLRGFIDDSPKRTIERVIELFGQNESSGFSVDPERFEQLAIDKVPAVAIVLPEAVLHEGEQDPKPLFEVVYGDVPLDEALSVIIKSGKGRIFEAAKLFLERYRAV